jgi:uncharacterized membrane protein
MVHPDLSGFTSRFFLSDFGGGLFQIGQVYDATGERPENIVTVFQGCATERV